MFVICVPSVGAFLVYSRTKAQNMGEKPMETSAMHGLAILRYQTLEIHRATNYGSVIRRSIGCNIGAVLCATDIVSQNCTVYSGLKLFQMSIEYIPELPNLLFNWTPQIPVTRTRWLLITRIRSTLLRASNSRVFVQRRFHESVIFRWNRRFRIFQ